MYNTLPGIMGDSMARNIRHTAFFLLAILFVLLGYVSYIQTIDSDFWASHPLNRRAAAAEHRMQRGTITASGGEKLAYSQNAAQNNFSRHYPYGEVFAHVVGYDSDNYGKSGIESTANSYLSGLHSPLQGLGPINNFHITQAGNNVQLTINAKLQEVAYQALGNHRGAIVALSPQTGAILAMVSKPAFNPETLDKDWSALSQSDDGILLNRAAQGLYPPGSIIKVMIAAGALTEKTIDMTKTINCQGSLHIGPDYVLNESHHAVHGQVNLSEAFAVSCNVMFGQLALQMGREKIAQTFARFGIEQPALSEMAEVKAHVPDFGKMSDGDLAQAGIGQSDLLVTPVKMAMLASAVANQGKMMQPYILQKITTADGSLISTGKPKEWLQPMSAELANIMQKMMVMVVDKGTGGGAAIRGVKVAGKTGTAENPHGDSHAWFIGFAPADEAQIAIAVIVENGGSGGEIAAPIARQIFLEALR